MEEKEKLKELISQIKKENPDITNEECVKIMMYSFSKWKPFFDQELEIWETHAEELATNYLD
jgi:hypothetical protein